MIWYDTKIMIEKSGRRFESVFMLVGIFCRKADHASENEISYFLDSPPGPMLCRMRYVARNGYGGI